MLDADAVINSLASSWIVSGKPPAKTCRPNDDLLTPPLVSLDDALDIASKAAGDASVGATITGREPQSTTQSDAADVCRTGYHSAGREAAATDIRASPGCEPRASE